MTIEDALAARDVALERVQRAADPAWCARALDVIHRVCLDREDWHSDVLWEYGLDEPAEARALGPVVMKAARLGWCRRTMEGRPSVRSHGAPKPVWQSLIFAGSATEQAA